MLGSELGIAENPKALWSRWLILWSDEIYEFQNFFPFTIYICLQIIRVAEQVPMPVERLKPEDFLRLIEKSRLGKLKIYLGHKKTLFPPGFQR
jgi:hypothetical protein